MVSRNNCFCSITLFRGVRPHGTPGRRPNTYAARKLEDDIPEEIKKRRLTEIIQLQSKHSLYRHEEMVGKTFEVLVEGTSKKSEAQLFGRTDTNSVVVFDRHDFKPGDFVHVKINSCTTATLLGSVVASPEA